MSSLSTRVFATGLILIGLGILAIVVSVVRLSWTEGLGGLGVARQQHGATVSPVAWGQARSISDDVVMMAAGAGGVKSDGVVAVVER